MTKVFRFMLSYVNVIVVKSIFVTVELELYLCSCYLYPMYLTAFEINLIWFDLISDSYSIAFVCFHLKSFCKKSLDFSSSETTMRWISTGDVQKL